MTDRSQQLDQWLAQLGYRDFSLKPASEDASFRSYWRLQTPEESLIVMDAPPEKEPCEPFIAVAEKLRAAGLSAPEVLAQDLRRGFLLLTDFGRHDYLSQLDDGSAAALYGDALDSLLLMQSRIDASDLPPYDEALLEREMELFRQWFLGQSLQISLDAEQRAQWLSIKNTLIASALQQPRVFVHRDYHSRNLMRLDSGNPGLLDFQDAMHGPLTYDLVSLLRDCYIDWPPALVEQYALDYYARARAKRLVEVDAAQFMRWFNLMGIQRHLKAIGIFSRLRLRDGKSGYLKDIPRTLDYVRQVSEQEPAMADLHALIETLDLRGRAQTLVAS